MDKHEFADFVSTMRYDSGLTTKEFAEDIGVDIATVWRWENAKTCPKSDAMPYWIEKILDACS